MSTNTHATSSVPNVSSRSPSITTSYPGPITVAGSSPPPSIRRISDRSQAVAPMLHAIVAIARPTAHLARIARAPDGTNPVSAGAEY